VQEIVYKSPQELVFFEKNAKKHSNEQVKHVAESIKRFGFLQPVVADEHNTIIVGHCRVEAARSLNLKLVPCIVVDYLTKAEADALRVIDNKLSEQGEFDEALLKGELERLDIGWVDFGITDFLDLPEPELDLGDLTEGPALDDCDISLKVVFKYREMFEVFQEFCAEHGVKVLEKTKKVVFDV
jgi:hypothetical protein